MQPLLQDQAGPDFTCLIVQLRQVVTDRLWHEVAPGTQKLPDLQSATCTPMAGCVWA